MWGQNLQCGQRRADYNIIVTINYINLATNRPIWMNHLLYYYNNMVPVLVVRYFLILAYVYLNMHGLTLFTYNII